MTRALLLSTVTLLAVACAAAPSIRGAASAREPAGISSAAPVAHGQQSVAVREPSAPGRTIAVGAEGAPSNAATQRLRGEEQLGATRGQVPQKARGEMRMNPEATAFGGVDNNPIEGPGLNVSDVKDRGTRERKSSSGRVLGVDRRARDKMTRASWIEGNNPCEDGSISSRNEVVEGDGRGSASTATGRAHRKLADVFSPATQIVNDNPADDSGEAVAVPRDRETSQSAERYRAQPASLVPTVQSPRIVAPDRAPREITRPHAAEAIRWRRSAVSDNNPMEN